MLESKGGHLQIGIAGIVLPRTNDPISVAALLGVERQEGKFRFSDSYNLVLTEDSVYIKLNSRINRFGGNSR